MCWGGLGVLLVPIMSSTHEDVRDVPRAMEDGVSGRGRGCAVGMRVLRGALEQGHGHPLWGQSVRVPCYPYGLPPSSHLAGPLFERWALCFSSSILRS